MAHAASQPSPGARLPSSQASVAWRTPLPHAAGAPAAYVSVMRNPPRWSSPLLRKSSRSGSCHTYPCSQLVRGWFKMLKVCTPVAAPGTPHASCTVNTSSPLMSMSNTEKCAVTVPPAFAAPPKCHAQLASAAYVPVYVEATSTTRSISMVTTCSSVTAAVRRRRVEHHDLRESTMCPPHHAHDGTGPGRAATALSRLDMSSARPHGTHARPPGCIRRGVGAVLNPKVCVPTWPKSNLPSVNTGGGYDLGGDNSMGNFYCLRQGTLKRDKRRR